MSSVFTGSVLALLELRQSDCDSAAGDCHEHEPQADVAVIAGSRAGGRLCGGQDAEVAAGPLAAGGLDIEGVGLACGAGIEELRLEGDVPAVAADGELAALFKPAVAGADSDVLRVDGVGADELEMLAAVDNVVVGINGLE